MKLAIFQPYFYPYIGYFQLLNAVDTFVIFDDVHFIKRGWINRNYILFNGEPHRLNLPLQHASSNKLILETKIVPDNIAKQKIVETIRRAYRKAPYFEVVFPQLADWIMYPSNDLTHYIEHQLEKTCLYLGIKLHTLRSSSLNIPRGSNPQSRIIEIAKSLKASEYINPIGGRELYQFNAFQEAGLKLHFLHSNNNLNQDAKQELAPNLSIIDIMMQNSDEHIRKELLPLYTLSSQ